MIFYWLGSNDIYMMRFPFCSYLHFNATTCLPRNWWGIKFDLSPEISFYIVSVLFYLLFRIICSIILWLKWYFFLLPFYLFRYCKKINTTAVGNLADRRKHFKTLAGWFYSHFLKTIFIYHYRNLMQIGSDMTNAIFWEKSANLF